MKILAIETSCRNASLALLEDEILIKEHFMGHIAPSKGLISVIDSILTDFHLTPHGIDFFGISLGPGSFTGLRVGISTVKGLAYATGKRVVGVSTLDVLAHNIYSSDKAICPIIDAKKKLVYTALYAYHQGKLTKLIHERAARPKDFLAFISSGAAKKPNVGARAGTESRPYVARPIGRPEMAAPTIEGDVIFLGDAIANYREMIWEELADRAFFVPEELNYPKASVLGLLCIKEIEKGNFLDIDSFVPNYIRISEAEEKFCLTSDAS